ncbi:MAG: alpha/beta hydrolase [Burkholderiales bacterium]|nr:alpha/beta hydrolase [Burkholderiales bacterium]
MVERALPEAAHELLAQARRVRTALGRSAGSMLWTQWGTCRAGVPPVVLLHGGSGSWMHWLRCIAPLVDSGREVWAPDLPGCGDSDLPPGARDADDMVAPLHAGLRELLAGGACDLAGFSFGALAGTLLEAARPGTVRRLLLVGAPGLGVPPARVPLRAWRHLASEAAQDEVHRHNLAALMLADERAIDETALRLHAWNVARDRLQRRRLAGTDALVRALARVTCPVSVVYGENDALYLGRVASLEARFRATGCDLRGFIVIPGAGHWVAYEQPQALVAALGAALGSSAP